MKRREDLATPRAAGRVGVQYDSDTFGAFSESIANFLGTARFLVWQTIVITVWILLNTLLPHRYQFDPWNRGLVLLTLVLSIQASYAAPLILLAQNRQERRDRVTTQNDREVAERTQADTEFLAREIASVRLSMSDIESRTLAISRARNSVSACVRSATSRSVCDVTRSRRSWRF